MTGETLGDPVFFGFLGHATSTDALPGIVERGALLPASRLLAADGESLANPTCHEFVSLDDGNHPLAADALLLRRALLEGADPADPDLNARIGRLLAVEGAHQRDVMREALQSCSMLPDPERARIFVAAVEHLRHAVDDGQLVDLALRHLHDPPRYRLFPSNGPDVIARLLHDLLLELDLVPGAREHPPYAGQRVAEATERFRDRLERLAVRYRAPRPRTSRRAGLILLFPREPLLALTHAHGPRERRTALVRLAALDTVLAPRSVHPLVRTLLPGVVVRGLP